MAYNLDEETLKYYTQRLKEKLAEKDEIPTKTSDLTNDNGFITIDEVPKTDLTNYQTKSDITLNTTDKTVIGAINELETNSHTHINKDILDAITTEKITSWNNKAEVSDIPTKTSDLINDSGYLTSIPDEYVTDTELNAKGYLTEHIDISGKVDKIEGKGLSTNDLTDELKTQYDTAYTHSQSAHAPIDAEANIQSDWNVTDITNDAYILNKPTIPNKTSDLTNDSGFITSADIPAIPSTDGLATETYVNNAISNMVGTAPETLDTLNELASALGNDPNFATTVTTLIGTKSDVGHNHDDVYASKASEHTHENKGVLDLIDSVKYAEWDAKSTFSGDYNDLTNKPIIPSEYTLPTASTTTLGGIKVGNGLSISDDGTLSSSGGSVDLTDYQTKTDSTLTTDDKTIVGAINELDIDCVRLGETIDDSVISVEENVLSRISTIEIEYVKAEDYEDSTVIIDNDLTSRISALETIKADKTEIPTSLPANGGNADTVGGFSIWVGTQTEYDAITTKSSTTLYFIREV